MFDAVTAHLLSSAPAVPDLDPQDIPAQLTKHYANLVSARLRGEVDSPDEDGEVWSLERIADTYELITSLHTDSVLRKASAFVAGTAQQILARRQSATNGDILPANINRDRVDPAIAAAVLFLAAEQYADANEAASYIRPPQEGQLYEATILSENIADLARGRLGRILERAERWRSRSRKANRDLAEQALAALLETLISGLEIFAARFLDVPIPLPSSGRFDGARDAFLRVLEISAAMNSEHNDDLGGNILCAYAGPHHLAALLIATHDGMNGAALTTLPPPDGADPEFWGKWLRLRASSFPFIWPNHREAIAKGFHQTGNSAVVVLPTGAGKTTVSSLKIAGVLARGKKVVFLAPTHALVEQLTSDLQKMFPKDILGSIVSSDFDLLFQSGAQLQEIEVMTPERCLAMLSFAPDAFSEVGLLVFDECHLLSPQSRKIRRALDGMLCLLGFNHIALDADFLFLSAMLKNAEEFADWICQLTGRACVCVDLLWKPSRQARGVLIYKGEDLDKAKQGALAVQAADNKKKGQPAKGLRASAARELVAQPWAIWGLQHNWLGQKTAHCILNEVLDEPVTLSGDNKYGPIYLKPNANQVAVRLAVAAARNDLNSIVFVNTKNDAVSVARDISAQLDEAVKATETEQERWDALQAELGDLKHALLPQPAIAVPHNSSMLRLERELAERMFKRGNGAKVIVATPTLAQGLNLPAHLAILAGDKRSGADQNGREDLEAHEILNAAARAGRAGHLANGVVLLIPEPIISFSQDKPLETEVIQKLKSILPEDDRCVVINDPLEIVLDRLMQGESLDADVRYMVNRMATFHETGAIEEPTLLFDLRKSLGAFAASKRQAEAEFEAKIIDLQKAIAKEIPDEADNTMAALASQSGLSMALLSNLKKRVSVGTGSLPVTVEDWLIWTVNWLAEDESARASLLYDVKRSVLGACGRKKDGEITGEELTFILPGLLAWIGGKPLAYIEKELGGTPDAGSLAKQVCPRARELVGGVIPRSISFIMGLVSHVVKEVNPFDAQESLSHQVVECLGTAVRKGYDTPEKVFFAGNHPTSLSRVQMHELWSQQNTSE
ncbi:MAG: DEAD/DEAH box helicase [Desulfurivibrionaceae bacterium]|nr:DEAD/DEAH box helicase [Desulfurivibrionaceae bacterium]